MRSPVLILTLVLAALASAPGEAARRLADQAPVSAQAGGLRGPLAPPSMAAKSLPYSPLPAGLAGAEAAPPAPTASPAISRTPPAVGPSALASISPQNASDCRLACAGSYYFCLAGEDSQACPTQWTRCLSDCRLPAAP